MPSLINDSTLNVLQSALDGLSQRQQVIGHNIANAETPGYQALAVSFEKQLQQAMTASPLELTTTRATHLDLSSGAPHGPEVTPRQNSTFRLDGNNVDIDLEMTQLAETSIRFQSLTQIVARKLALLKAIAASR